MKLIRRPKRKAKWLRNHTFTQKLLEVCGIEGKEKMTIESWNKERLVNFIFFHTELFH